MSSSTRQKFPINKTIKAKDLARLLGISPSTVSTVLNNKPGINKSTRKLVLDKMIEPGSLSPTYGYKPQTVDFIYSVIFKKHGKIVGDTPFFSQLTGDIERSCRSNGYNLQIAYFNEGSGLSTTLPLIHSEEYKGLLLLTTKMALADASVFISLEYPTVLLDSTFNEIALDIIVINNRQAAGCAAEQLIHSDHTDIGYLHSACHINNSSERKDGYHRELRRSGLHIPTEHEYKLAPTVDGAYSEVKEILSHDPVMPTVFFADNDIIALSAMRALKEKGYRVPGDISIIGIDDMSICELINPPLTTMHVPKHQIGVQAVKRLLEKINSNSREVLTIEIRTSLVEHQSVCTVKGQRPNIPVRNKVFTALTILAGMSFNLLLQA